MLICVTGMHRSGTSLLARIVNLLGVGFGPPGALMPPGTDNRRGYWERRDIVACNDEILSALGGSWDRLPPLAVDWDTDDRLAEARDRVGALVGELTVDADGPQGFKDPRCAVLLPFWRTVAEVDRVVVSLRRPEAVVASIQRRNGLGANHAAALYVRYLTAVLATERDPIVVPYAAMLSDPRGTSIALAGRLGLPSPEGETLERIQSFVSPDLDHGDAVSAEQADLSLARWVFEAAQDLDAHRSELESLHVALSHAAAEASPGGDGRNAELTERARLAERQARHQEESAALAAAQRERTRFDAELADARARDELTFLEARRLRLRLDLERTAAARAQELAFAAGRARRDSFDHEARVEALRGERDALAEEKAALESRLAAQARLYQRLRDRRAVRAATFLARGAKPLFRVVRRFRRARQTPPPTASAVRDDGGAAPADPVVALADETRQRSSSQNGSTVAASPAERAESPETPGRPVTRAPSSDAEPESSGQGTLRPGFDLAVDDLLSDVGPVTIIVPVYNAADQLARCIQALIANTSYPAQLLLIDDASTDPRVAVFLEEAARHPNVRVLTNEENLGFTRTVNRGLAEASGDVVVLNADTEVTPRWLQNLLVAAYQDASIGTVTPVSDNAGAFSVPERGVENRLTDSLSRDEVGRLITRTAALVRPDTPTANGFCMFVKRAVLDSVGLLDEEAFPRGYGEENDLSMRARDAGWRHVVDDATLVLHHGSASFGSEKRELIERGLAKMDERWPEYRKLVQPFLHGPEMSSVRTRVAGVLGEPPARVLPRVLLVDHGAPGGVRQHVDHLADGVEGFEPVLLESDGRRLRLSRRAEGRWDVESVWRLDRPISPLDRGRADYRRAVIEAITASGVELVHLHHLLHHAPDIVEAARDLGLPTIVSLHDYYLVCPTIQLMDDEGRFCGGRCTPGQGQCRVAYKWVRRDMPHLKHSWVHSWQRRHGELLSSADALVTFTEATRDVFLDTYPHLEAGRLHVIPHGLDISQPGPLGRPPRPDEPIRVVILGNLNSHKGTDVLRAVKALDAGGRLEFHMVGRVAPSARDLGVVHGPYEPSELPSILADIAPSMAAVLSPWGETFCFTLSEAWSFGLPVVAADVGALGERVRANGGGWLVDPHDPQDVYDTFLRAAEGAEYAQAAEQASSFEGRSVAAMAGDYGELYTTALAGARSFARRTTTPDHRTALTERT